MVSPEKWDKWMNTVLAKHPSFRIEMLPQSLKGASRLTVPESVVFMYPGYSLRTATDCCGVYNWQYVYTILPKLTDVQIALLGLFFHRPRPTWEMYPTAIIASTATGAKNPAKPADFEVRLLELEFTPILRRRNGNSGNYVTVWILGLGEETPVPEIAPPPAPKLETPLVPKRAKSPKTLALTPSGLRLTTTNALRLAKRRSHVVKSTQG